MAKMPNRMSGRANKRARKAGKRVKATAFHLHQMHTLAITRAEWVARLAVARETARDE